MKIHFRVTVEAGPRTETAIEAYSTAINPRSIRFANGIEVTENELSRYIERSLKSALDEIKARPEK
jgi:hypothetical protein